MDFTKKKCELHCIEILHQKKIRHWSYFTKFKYNLKLFTIFNNNYLTQGVSHFNMYYN